MKIMRMYTLFAVWLLLIVAGGCNRSVTDSESSPKTSGSKPVTQSALTIQASNSPAGVDSREPEMTSTADGRIILSWVEKIGSKRYALRFATRDASSWSMAQTVAEGENWFINWADFPSVIALADGSLAAHWLVKSGSGTYAYDS